MDRAGLDERDKPVDVPYEKYELRRPVLDSLRLDLVLAEITAAQVLIRAEERMGDGAPPFRTVECRSAVPARIECEGITVEVAAVDERGVVVRAVDAK